MVPSRPWWVCAIALSLSGCRVGDVLDVPIPPNVVDPGSLNSANGAEALRAGAIAAFAGSVGGEGTNGTGTLGVQVLYSGELADEYRDGSGNLLPVELDARRISLAEGSIFDGTYTGLQKARLAAAQAIASLEQYAASAPRGHVGEMFAIEAYAEVLLAEDVCNGIPLTTVSRDGLIAYGVPLPGDSVFAHALTLFDSADAWSNADPLIAGLAAVGRGRALLDRGRFSDAATAVSATPVGYGYGTQIAPTMTSFYEDFAGHQSGAQTVADRKGGNGLDFVSANDPRLPTTVLGTIAASGLPTVYPLKFPLHSASNDSVPLATGVEASLIRAEALLPANGGGGTAWLDTLNALRTTTGGVAGLAPLTDPGTSDAQVDLLFRERAFWMFGTGHRLGDLRRLIRQYHRDASTVFPTGNYDNGAESDQVSTYGTDVNAPIGTVEQANPNFHGCLDRNA
jgi:starch-binding outer membrane protein, SusD/RagB family